ncbi:MAG: hypothetical protein R3F39_18735 [Myxococcota bacterium]
MSSGFDQVVSSLEARFDHMSARTVAREAAAAAGLTEQKDYSDKEVQLLVDALATLGDRMEGVWTRLGAAPTGQAVPAPAPKAAAKEEAAPAKEAAPPAKDDKADAKAEAKDDKADAKDDKADAKDTKADAKADAKDAKADDGGSKKKK